MREVVKLKKYKYYITVPVLKVKLEQKYKSMSKMC